MRRIVLSAGDIDRALTRIAHEILEANKGPEGLVLLGIPRRGYPLAVRLAAKLAAADPAVDPERIVGQLDITMFRDDLARQPTRPPARTMLPAGGIDDRVVVLVDDVPSTRSSTSAAPAACGSPSSWTAATASCPSAPTMWARTSPPPAPRRSASALPRSTPAPASPRTSSRSSPPPRRGRPGEAPALDA